MILFEEKDTQDFQKQLDELEGSIKVTLYDAQNGHNYAKEYLQDLFKTNKKLCAKMFKSIEIFRKMGVQTPEKYSKHLQDGIYELRANVATNEARQLYFFVIGNEIIITNGFTKKTQETPKSEILKAKKLRNEYYSKR